MNWNEPAIWSALIAGIALLLSQLPPIRELIKGTKVVITAPSKFLLFHFMGSVQVNIFLDIHNLGGSNVLITKIKLIMPDDDGQLQELEAQSYIHREEHRKAETSTPEFNVGRLAIKAGDYWSETVRFYKDWSDTEEQTITDLILRVRNETASSLPNSSLASVKSETLSQVISFFEHKFKLHRGNYRLFIVAFGEHNKVVALQGFEFTLYESHIQALKAYVDEYKFGSGICYPIKDPAKYLWVRLRPMEDDKRTAKFFKECVKANNRTLND